MKIAIGNDHAGIDLKDAVLEVLHARGIEVVDCGTYAAAREKGLVRSEGKEYVMKDGDVTLFRFNV